MVPVVVVVILAFVVIVAIVAIVANKKCNQCRYGIRYIVSHKYCYINLCVLCITKYFDTYC